MELDLGLLLSCLNKLMPDYRITIDTKQAQCFTIRAEGGYHEPYTYDEIIKIIELNSDTSHSKLSDDGVYNMLAIYIHCVWSIGIESKKVYDEINLIKEHQKRVTK